MFVYRKKKIIDAKKKTKKSGSGNKYMSYKWDETYDAVKMKNSTHAFKRQELVWMHVSVKNNDITVHTRQ